EVQQVPELDQKAQVEREGEIVRRYLVDNRLQAEQIGLDGQRVFDAELGIRGVRERRVQPLAVLAHALVQGAYEIRIAPAADAGCRVRCDIGRINRTERRMERQ